MRIDNRVAVITGASSGIGAALARQLGEAGVRVGLIALPDSNLDAETKGIISRGGTAVAAPADVTDRAALRTALDRLSNELGAIDLLILSAGVAPPTPVATFSTDAAIHVLGVNLLGAIHAIEAVLPDMVRRRGGHIVGVASLWSYRGVPRYSAYCASKSALAVLLESLRIELREHGVQVTTVRPGFVRTPMTRASREAPFAMEADQAARTILKGIAARRREINFPWQSAFITRLGSLLPCGIRDPLLAKAFDRDQKSSSQ